VTCGFVAQFQAEFRGVAEYYRLAFNRHRLGPLSTRGRSTCRAERPIMDFDERDLLDWAVSAGFTAVELDYRAQVDVPDTL
jgi:hypothetical protein